MRWPLFSVQRPLYFKLGWKCVVPFKAGHVGAVSMLNYGDHKKTLVFGPTKSERSLRKGPNLLQTLAKRKGSVTTI